MGTLLGCSWKGSSRRGLERVSTSRNLVFRVHKVLPFRTFGAVQVSILSRWEHSRVSKDHSWNGSSVAPQTRTQNRRKKGSWTWEIRNKAKAGTCEKRPQGSAQTRTRKSGFVLSRENFRLRPDARKVRPGEGFLRTRGTIFLVKKYQMRARAHRRKKSADQSLFCEQHTAFFGLKIPIARARRLTRKKLIQKKSLEGRNVSNGDVLYGSDLVRSENQVGTIQNHLI